VQASSYCPPLLFCSLGYKGKGSGCIVWGLKVQALGFWVQISFLSLLSCDIGQSTDPLCLHLLICKMGLCGGLNKLANVKRLEQCRERSKFSMHAGDNYMEKIFWI
jgi:hypothetical protein